MFRNLIKKYKNLQLEKVRNRNLLNCLSFVLILYILVSPNLQISLKNKITCPSKSQEVEFVLKYIKFLTLDSFHRNLTKT